MQKELYLNSKSHKHRCTEDCQLQWECMSRRGYGKHWKSDPIHLHPNDAGKLRYSYTVKYRLNSREKLKRAVKHNYTESIYKENYEEKIFDGKNQYDVFQQFKSNDHEKVLFLGQFFFVKWLCDGIEGEKNIKEILINAEHVGFGCTYCKSREEQSFFQWVNRESLNNLSPYKSAYICSLLGQFHRHRTNWSQFESQIDKSASDGLLEALRCCPKDILPQSSLQFIKCIHKKLFIASSFNSNLEYLLFFGEHFDTDYLLRSASCIGPLTRKENVNEIVSKLMSWLLKLERNQNVDKMLVFVILNAPTLLSFWIICRHLGDDISHRHHIKSKMKWFLTQEIKSDVLDPAVWKNAPGYLKPEFAAPFCAALREQVEERTEFDHKLLTEIILDKDLQKYASNDVLQLLKIISNSTKPAFLRAACGVLNALKFNSFWQTMKDGDKFYVVDSLFSCELETKVSTSKTNIELAVMAFQVTEELSMINILKKYEDRLQKHLNETAVERCGVHAIMDACDKIQKSSGAIGRKLYIDLLFNLAEINQENAEIISKLMYTIKSFSLYQPFNIDR